MKRRLSTRQIDGSTQCVAVQSLDENDANEATIDAFKATPQPRRLPFLFWEGRSS